MEREDIIKIALDKEHEFGSSTKDVFFGSDYVVGFVNGFEFSEGLINIMKENDSETKKIYMKHISEFLYHHTCNKNFQKCLYDANILSDKLLNISKTKRPG